MRLRFTLLLLVSFPLLGISQQLPNSGFENWTNHPGGMGFSAYDEPNSWATGNAALNVAPGATPPTQKTTDAHNGTYAAKLVTQSIFGQIAAGNLFTGKFELNLTEPEKSAKFGVPYTERPSAFNVYYKYTSVSGDSCAIYLFLFRKNVNTGEKDTVGAAYFQSTTSVSSYTKLSLPITYKTSDTPDSIAVVFTSSAGGALLKGRAGSTLFIDDFSLEFPSTSTSKALSSVGAALYPNPATSQVTLSNAPSEEGSLYLYNSYGVLVKEMQWNATASPAFSLNGITNGIYTAVIITREDKVYSEKLVIK